MAFSEGAGVRRRPGSEPPLQHFAARFDILQPHLDVFFGVAATRRKYRFSFYGSIPLTCETKARLSRSTPVVDQQK